ncbi:unnamed protein product [Tilletia controversa]|nr:unnamed protein product [Tilletia controversa]
MAIGEVGTWKMGWVSDKQPTSTNPTWPPREDGGLAGTPGSNSEVNSSHLRFAVRRLARLLVRSNEDRGSQAYRVQTSSATTPPRTPRSRLATSPPGITALSFGRSTSSFPSSFLPAPSSAPPRASPTMGQQGSQLLTEIEQNTNCDASEIQRLKKRFMKLDRDGSGSIDRDEFLQIPAIANNPLALRMIAIFDEDGGGTVDFQEFVAGLSAFSSQGSREEKLRFAFKVYDMDRDGYISNGELFLVLKMMVGNNLKDQQLQQIVDKTIMEADKDGDGKLDFEEFQDMVASTDVAKQLTLEDLF